MPTVHGEKPVLRVLDKESMSEKFRKPHPRCGGLCRRMTCVDSGRYIREPYGMVLVNRATRLRQNHHALRALNEIKSDEDKIITNRGPVEYQIRGSHADSGEREKGLTFGEAALHPAP